MKYFAMIDGRQYGPMELDDMVREGVRPDTYVWRKGLEDWILASDDPDICRYFRQRLSGTLPAQNISWQQAEDQRIAADAMEQEQLLNQLPPMARRLVRKSGIRLTKENLPTPDQQQSFPKALPIILYIVSLLVILLGFLLLQ